MKRLSSVFLWGLLISFLGTLPLGTLNVAAMQISVSENILNGVYFALGALLVEMIYVRISLVGINWVSKQKRLFRWMEWIALAIVVALAIGSFIAAANPHQSKNVMLENNIHRFLLGLMLSAINPVQIPFWFGWSTVLFAKKILQAKNSFYNIYITGIGLGTLFGFLVFIMGGRLVADKLDASQSAVNWVIGGIFTVTAVIFLIKIIIKKGGVEKLEPLES